MTRSRLVLAALASAALLAVSLPESADADGAKVDVRIRKRWKAGDAVTRTTKSVSTQKVDVMFEGTALFALNVRTTTEAERIEKCVEAGADGRRTRTLVHFVRWTQSQVNLPDGTPKGEDKSLTGATIEVERAADAAKSTWKVVNDVSLSKAASDALDQSFSSDEDLRDEAFEPGHPVAVGESWTVDGATLASTFASQLAVDPDKAKLTVTLTEAANGRGSLLVKGTMPTRFLKNPVTRTDDPWKEGGDAILEFRIAGPLDGSPAGAEQHSTFTYKGVAAGSMGEIHLDRASQGDVAIRAGGTIPETKAGTPPPPPGPTPTK